MKLMQYSISAVVDYSTESMENFIKICESAIDRIPTEQSIKFYLKNAANELVINSLEHGYDKNSGPIYVSIGLENDNIIFEIADLGKGVDISQLDLNRKADVYQDLTSRGWGLSILQKLFTDIKVSSNTPKGTVVCLTMPKKSTKGR